MPGRCTICASAQRGAAEQAIAAGKSVRSVAKQLKLSYQSLDRHTRNCVPKAIKKTALPLPPATARSHAGTVRNQATQASDRRDTAFADCLLAEVELLHRTTLDVLRESREGAWLEVPSKDDPNAMVKVYDLPNVKNTMRAIAEARKNLALIARLTGQLEPKQEERNRTVTFEEFEVLYLRAKREVKST